MALPKCNARFLPGGSLPRRIDIRKKEEKERKQLVLPAPPTALVPLHVCTSCFRASPCTCLPPEPTQQRRPSDGTEKKHMNTDYSLTDRPSTTKHHTNAAGCRLARSPDRQRGLGLRRQPLLAELVERRGLVLAGNGGGGSGGRAGLGASRAGGSLQGGLAGPAAL